jgi:hypothetical protein
MVVLVSTPREAMEMAARAVWQAPAASSVAAAENATSGGNGVYAEPGRSGGIGIIATDCSAYSSSSNCVYAGLFEGAVEVNGSLSKSGGSFKIDHPLEPAKKYLYHSFVESPDMMNVYNGNVVTDGTGRATVTLPDWFESLNGDFRYQLTSIGQFANAMVASEISNHMFSIRTDKPNVKVSWQVTGIRQDAWAPSPSHSRGSGEGRGGPGALSDLHPELFGHPGEPDIARLHHPLPKKLQHGAPPPM